MKAYLKHITLVVSLFITFQAVAQDDIEDSIKVEFRASVVEMIDSLHMDDSTAVKFLSIYEEYGLTMRDAYENRFGWMQLYQDYKAAVRRRDEEMSKILDESQFNYFVQRQKEIEREARSKQ